MSTYEFKRKVTYSLIAVAAVLFISGFMFAPGVYAAANEEAAAGGANTVAHVCYAAAVAFGIGALASGYAISRVGSAAMGAISEKPELASQALIFIALAEGLVVFGFITALMILGKV